MAELELVEIGTQNYIKMNIRNIFSKKATGLPAPEFIPPAPSKQMYEYPVFDYDYDGEKSPGELGPPKNYEPNYEILRARARQIYMESDVAKMIIKTYVDGILGSGLKLQAQPIEGLVDPSLTKEDLKDLSRVIERRYRVYCESKNSSYNGMRNYHQAQKQAMTSKLIDGDILCIRRYNNGPNVQYIESKHIKQPDIKQRNIATKRGNRIIHGVEINDKGTHVAYYVLQKDRSYKRIPRLSRDGKRIQAEMLYADTFRVDDVRGMPLFANSIEKLKKIDRYIEATVGSAEERAKIWVFTEHNHFSTGENPWSSAARDAANSGQQKLFDYKYPTISETDKQVQQTTGKQNINLPVGSKLSTIDSTSELRLKEFTEATLLYVTASIRMPLEIAQMKFESSYTAGRMAAQLWKTTITLERKEISRNQNQPFYEYFLDTEIARMRIEMKGYQNAKAMNDIITMGGYYNAKFTGPGVPQADPSKEVKAIALQLQLRLISHEEAAEILNDLDFDWSLDKLGDEYRDILKTIPEEFIKLENKDANFSEGNTGSVK